MAGVFGLFEPHGPVLTGKMIELRLPVAKNYAEWKALRQESRAELTLFEPRWADHELTRTTFIDRVRLAKMLAQTQQSFQFFIFEGPDGTSGGALLGGITLGNIRRGAAQTAEIGYWLGTRHVGKGFMRDAVATLLAFAFSSLHLHRIEAACIQGNARSIALLQHCGFHYEGCARAYLEINGQRQDHHLYACLPTDI